MGFDMTSLNLSATFNIFRVLARPSLCLPHATVSTFNDLPVPLGRAFEGLRKDKVDIRAVVLDKDDCFARPGENEVWQPFQVCVCGLFWSMRSACFGTVNVRWIELQFLSNLGPIFHYFLKFHTNITMIWPPCQYNFAEAKE
jgi:hypothetical protein